MSTTSDYFTQAELSLAAYGTFTIGAIPLEKLTDPSVGMSPTQAANFSERWNVLAQFTDSASGASATIFQARDVQGNPVGPKHLSIRGTEPDANDLIASGLLALGLPASLNPQFIALKAQIDNWRNDPTKLGDQTFTVTGHSLGGYLAAAVKEYYGAQVSDAYLYNAPGVAGPIGNILGIFGLAGVPSANVWNVTASEGASLISGLGAPVGTQVNIQIEAAPGAGLGNHSIVRLADALAIQTLYSKLTPGLTQAQLNALVDASGNPTTQTLEAALDSIRKLLLGASNAPSPTDDRDAFYTHLYALQDDPTYTNLANSGSAQLTILADRAKADIAGLAQQDNATGLATRYALKELNPFALIGADYSTFNTDGALDRYDPATGTGTLTTNYLADRADFLARKLWFSSEDKNPVDPNYVVNSTSNEFQNDNTYFKDFASGTQIAQGFAPATPHPNIQRYLFGDAQANTLTGGGIEDHLYGGSGGDTLNGNGGNDYLEGGTGNDLLVGGEGNDILNGGAGLDSYIWTSTPGIFGSSLFASDDGADQIIDSDKQGRILIDGQGLKLLLKQDATTWQTPDGKVTLSQGDTWTLAIQGGGSFDLGTTFSDGDYGLHRLQTATGGPLIRGDLAPIDFNASEPGDQVQYDALGNVQVTTTEAPGRNDQLYGSAGGDTLHGLAGDDVIEARGGDDLVEGGSGSDIVSGQDGNDTVWGDAAASGSDPLSTALANGESDTNQTTKGDWADGASGNDILLGTAAQDLLSGGSGNDLLIGGAGDDDRHRRWHRWRHRTLQTRRWQDGEESLQAANEATWRRAA